MANRAECPNRCSIDWQSLPERSTSCPHCGLQLVTSHFQQSDSQERTRTASQPLVDPRLPLEIKRPSRSRKRQKKKPSRDSARFEIQVDKPEQRSTHLQRDRRFLARFYGLCLVILAACLLAPAVVYLANGRPLDGARVPRWVYLAIFAGGLHLVYSLFLIQVPDWSTLYSVALFVLFTSCVYGVLAGALWMSQADSVIESLLQLPYAMKSSALICLGIAFCLSALASFVFGRDALMWKRSFLRTHSSAKGTV